METSKNNFPVPLPNCGVIFLHFYLTQFFEQQGLLLNKEFKNSNSKIKAIQLLLYLATSQVDFKEDFELSFFKILVEIPNDESITFSKPLNQKEISDCRVVLQSLIEHWSVLKKTSIETLQIQFLQRKGLVMFEDESIKVHLEQSGLDILLTYFPFDYSLVKFDWLKKLLRTSI